MRIVVPIKQVPQTNAVRMDDATGTMVREGVEAIVNPLDLYAIEIAIRLREANGGEVIALSMGPPKAIAALKEAIAMGCDSAVLLSDKAFAGSDTWATSYALAAAIRKLGAADLIICGERATDGDTGQVGPGIASFLDLPVVSYVSKVDCLHLAADGTSAHSLRVHRLVETGYEVLEMALPGVLTVVKEVADPRLPTLRGKLRAKDVAIPTWTVADLGLPRQDLGLDGSPTRVVKIFRPTVARTCEKLPAGDPAAVAAAADRVVEFVREKELL